jgi:sigma-54 specific flagellar transcriptional regulator A
MYPNLLSNLVGNSYAMQQVKKSIMQVAKTDATVIILGDSGTGKEVVAQCLHMLSARRSKPFVPINCGAIAANLLESELFGHEKGAFTGAITARKGRFEMAEKGTIFLDEIGDMPSPMQVKLLRVLQEQVYERVGGNKSFRSDVRVIAATHRNLEDSIVIGNFREDLFYRLNVFPIEIPPLHERVEDIPELLDFMLNKIKSKNRKIPILAEKLIIALQHYSWPGNVRELGNLVERLSILFPGLKVEYEDLPIKYQVEIPANASLLLADKILIELDINKDSKDFEQELMEKQGEDFAIAEFSRSPSLDEGLDLKLYLIEVEVQLIQKALTQTKGNVSQAAKLLQTNRTTLVEKIKKFNLT